MRFPILLWLFLPLATTAQQPTPILNWNKLESWAVFQSAEGRFSVNAPGPLREKVDSASTPLGAISYHSFICRVGNEKNGLSAVYLVSYCDYPESTVHSDSTDLLREFFAATVEESVRSSQGELVYQDDASLGLYPGKVWRINRPQDRTVIRTRAFVVNNRFYNVQSVMFGGASMDQSSDRFLESFKVY